MRMSLNKSHNTVIKSALLEDSPSRNQLRDSDFATITHRNTGVQRPKSGRISAAKKPMICQMRAQSQCQSNSNKALA